VPFHTKENHLAIYFIIFAFGSRNISLRGTYQGGGVMVDVVHDTPNQRCAGVKSIYSIKQA
jgi:hypothetical protein